MDVFNKNIKRSLSGFQFIDVYLYEEKEFLIRRKIYFFYLIPYWVKQYKTDKK